MISYELPLVLSTLPVVMWAGTLSLVEIVEHQNVFTSGIAHWHVFTPWGLAGFLVFIICATAEANRPPFDLPEAESEIIAGYLMEYSGFKYALFFLGEYLGLFALSGLGVTLFLGGWSAPVSFLAWIPSYLWFFLKLGMMVGFFFWIRGTLPRLRMDQLMNFAWKFMIPIAFINIAVLMIWHFSSGWGFPGALGVRWILGMALLILAYWALGRKLEQKIWVRRNYRLVEG
jgi:NADH-quinone oxidoreductase subunit H